ncbi:transcriptional regulator, partial [Bacillus anthracis]|nr:transcriptional regulator [Bacillus anthracis]
SIDISLSELTELEYKFVEYRYFKNWTIEKSALEIGYSDKALFVIRNQVMDKLLISLGSVVYM